MDSDGFVRDWNQSAEDLFGHSWDDAVGRELAELVIPLAYRSAHRAAFRLLFGASVRNDPEFAAVAEATIDRCAELIAELIDIEAASDHRRTLAHAMVGMAEATSRRVVNDEGEDDPER